MKSENNMRPTSAHWRRCVFGALFLPMVGIVIVSCGQGRPVATTTTTASAKPSPNPMLEYDNRMPVVRITGEPEQLHESELAKANKDLQAERNVYNYCRRAAAYEAMGRYDEAIADCNMAITLDPEDSSGYGRRASVYHKTGQHVLTIADYTRAISLDREIAGDWYYERGKIHQELGRYDVAIADYSRALKQEALGPEVYYSRGEAFYEKGDLAKAKADLDKCLQISAKSDLIIKARNLLTLIQERLLKRRSRPRL
jgi:tetratricopeptide (TPR) repeat protein